MSRRAPDRPPAAHAGIRSVGPAPRRAERPVDPAVSAARSARVTAVRVAVQSGQYVIDKDAVAKNLVDGELSARVK